MLVQKLQYVNKVTVYCLFCLANLDEKLWREKGKKSREEKREEKEREESTTAMHNFGKGHRERWRGKRKCVFAGTDIRASYALNCCDSDVWSSTCGSCEGAKSSCAVVVSRLGDLASACVLVVVHWLEARVWVWGTQRTSCFFLPKPVFSFRSVFL